MDLSRIEPDILASRIIADLMVKCPYDKCNWIGTAGRVDSHALVCFERPEFQVDEYFDDQGMLLVEKREATNNIHLNDIEIGHHIQRLKKMASRNLKKALLIDTQEERELLARTYNPTDPHIPRTKYMQDLCYAKPFKSNKLEFISSTEGAEKSKKNKKMEVEMDEISDYEKRWRSFLELDRFGHDLQFQISSRHFLVMGIFNVMVGIADKAFEAVRIPKLDLKKEFEMMLYGLSGKEGSVEDIPPAVLSQIKNEILPSLKKAANLFKIFKEDKAISMGRFHTMFTEAFTQGR